MRVAFIASEYNPIHNGHKYHIKKTKELGADAVVCVMSGNFVQRGDIAFAEKHLRAKTALMCGADLVLELPLKYAVSTASYFAEGFIKTVAASGLDGFVSCGATSVKSDLEVLCDYCFSDEAESFTRDQLTKGINYPRAKSIYLQNKLGFEFAEIFSEPNNILAIEYINAIRKFAPYISFNTVSRIGVAHDSETTCDMFTSASNLRKIIYSASDFNTLPHQICKFVPEDVLELLKNEIITGNIPSSPEMFSIISMSRLISADTSSLAEINNVNGGVDNRILKNIRTCGSLNEIADKTKSKIHTHSRIRQILLNAVLGIKKEDLLCGPSYIRVLGFNDCGRKILHKARDCASLPIVSNLSELNTSSYTTARDAELDYTAGKLFSLCLNKDVNGNPEYDIPPVYLR